MLDEERRDDVVSRVVAIALELEGVDLVCHRHDGVAVISSPAGALAFAPGEEVRDPRGGGWIVRGSPEVLAGRVEDGVFHSEEYPDALARVWAALDCPTAGDVLLSASAGQEFADWGGTDHVGGGSHGSLHRSDSLGALVFAGVDPPRGHDGMPWSICDVRPMVLEHFGLPPSL